jgi:hypothetical protein
MANYKFIKSNTSSIKPVVKAQQCTPMVRTYLQRLAAVLEKPPAESPQEGESKLAASKVIRSRRGVDIVVIGVLGQPAHCVVTDASGKPINDPYLTRFMAQLKGGKYIIYHNAGDESSIDEMDILYRMTVLDFLVMYVKSLKVMSACT